MNEYTSCLLVSKYRPKKLEDLVLSEDDRIKFQEYIDNREIPHLLFIGPPGSGKSTVSEILVSKNGILSSPSDNLLTINGSSQQNRGIGFINSVVEPFLGIPPVGSDRIRIVYIDESDNMTSDAFDALRAIIEKYQKFSRFIFTGNNLYKLPGPLQSRLQMYKFNKLSIEFVTDYCKKILDDEKIIYKLDDLKFVVDLHYPDVRKILNTLERYIINNTLKVKHYETNEKKIISCILQIIKLSTAKTFSQIDKIISEVIELLDGEDLYFTEIYSTLFYMKDISIPVKIIINRYTNLHNTALVPSMHFIAMIFEMIKFLGGK
jgi:DNA polymerase III delta prime subunit